MDDDIGSLDPVVVADGFDQRDPAAPDCIDQPALEIDVRDGSELPDVDVRGSWG
jgi:hypothetical protein